MPFFILAQSPPPPSNTVWSEPRWACGCLFFCVFCAHPRRMAATFLENKFLSPPLRFQLTFPPQLSPLPSFTKFFFSPHIFSSALLPPGNEDIAITTSSSFLRPGFLIFKNPPFDRFQGYFCSSLENACAPQCNFSITHCSFPYGALPFSNSCFPVPGVRVYSSLPSTES